MAAKQNLIINSVRVGGTHWGVTSTVGVSTLTADYATGPDGVAGSAARVQLAAGSLYNHIYPNDGTTVSNPGGPRYHTLSAWMRATGSSAKMRFRQTLVAGASNQWSPDIALDATWRRYEFAALVTGANSPVFATDAAAEAADFLIWGPQLEWSNAAGQYVATPTNSAYTVEGAPPDRISAGTARSRIYPQNLLSQSLLSAWSTFQASVASGVTAPDGTATAVTLTDTANVSHFAYLTQPTLPTDGRPVCLAGIFKAGTKFQVYLAGMQGAVNAIFDLTGSGSVVSVTSGGYIPSLWTSPAKISVIGGGWYLCGLTYATAAGTPQARVSPAVAGSAGYLGDGTGTILAWDVWMVRSNTPGERVRTTGAAYDLGAPRVLINP